MNEVQLQIIEVLALLVEILMFMVVQLFNANLVFSVNTKRMVYTFFL